MSKLTELLQSLSPAAPVRKAFWINDPEALWQVADGGLDVFIQRRDSSGDVQGARHHVYHVNAGQFAIGVDFAQLPSGWGAIAVPLPGTSLSPLGAKQFAMAFEFAESAAEASRLVNDWVCDTSLSLGSAEPVRQFRALLSGERCEAEQEEILIPGERVVWAHVQTGNTVWMGRYDFVVNALSGPCPMTRDAYLKVMGNVSVQVMDPASLSAKGLLWKAMQLHLNFVLRYTVVVVDELNASESSRLENKANSSMIITREALGRLMSVGQDDEEQGRAQQKRERLLAALEPIGKRLAVDFQMPPPAEAEAFARDPVPTVCASSNVRYRQVKLKEAWWTTDNTPLLATLGDSKDWVALLPVNDKRYVLFDPSTGKTQKMTEELASTVGAFAYQFYRSFPAKVLKPLDLLIFGAQGLKRDLVWILCLAILSALLGMVTPVATGKLIDTVIPSADIPAIWQMIAALFAAGVAIAMFSIAQSIGMLRIESKMDNAVQSAVWDRVLKLPVPFFRQYESGDLATRINGINTIRHALSGTTVHALLSSSFSALNMFLLFSYSAKLALTGIGLVLVAVVVTLIIGYIKLRYERQLAEVMGNLSGMTLQYLRGITKIRVSSAEARAFSNWAASFSNYRRLSFNAQHMANVEHTFFAGYQVMVTGVLFAVIGMFLMKSEADQMSTGSFIAFSAAFGTFFGGVVGLAETLLGLLNLVPIYERAKPILEAMPEASGSRAHPGEIQGGIEVVNLGFRYGDGPDILKDVSLNVRPGAYVALVGPSGSGKSTLLRLLLGFEKPTAGSLYYDNQNMDDIDVNALRRQFGVVLQNGQLMSGDIYTNIVGSANLPLEHAWEAARRVGLDEDINQMPMGMHTVISEGASTLSGGQRQRILIARAIVHRPRVLFFDEATSALDNRTQGIVTESLDKLQSTRIVIAHRLSTVINADRIIVLQAGQIVQDGTYQQLIDLPGPFQDMARRQIA